jgi:hypothetical protein
MSVKNAIILSENPQLKKDLISNLSDKEIYNKYPFIKDYSQLVDLYFLAKSEQQ